MRLSLATAAFMLTATAAFAQGANSTATGTNGTTMAPGAALSTMGGTSPNGVRVPGATVNTTPDTTSSSPSAVQTTNTTARTGAAPVPGRNSFTMGEARRRITSAGFANVSGLKKDNQGIWRGQAQKNGAPVGVALDYQGNVVGQ